LQGIDARKPLFVTLNPARDIAPEHVFDRHEFSHPVFDIPAMAAQHDIQALQGTRNTWFCGAHLRYGFHEDGLWSAVNVAARFGIGVPWREREHANAPERIYQPVAARPAFEGIPA
jgi:predicted NAD/FAD-binding protein